MTTTTARFKLLRKNLKVSKVDGPEHADYPADAIRVLCGRRIGEQYCSGLLGTLTLNIEIDTTNVNWHLGHPNSYLDEGLPDKENPDNWDHVRLGNSVFALARTPTVWRVLKDRPRHQMVGRRPIPRMWIRVIDSLDIPRNSDRVYGIIGGSPDIPGLVRCHICSTVNDVPEPDIAEIGFGIYDGFPESLAAALNAKFPSWNP